jgi:hypothetical protein
MPTFLLDPSKSDVAGEGGPRRYSSPALDGSGIQLRAARTLVIRLNIIRLRDGDRKGQECSSVTFRSFLATGTDEHPVEHAY